MANPGNVQIKSPTEAPSGLIYSSDYVIRTLSILTSDGTVIDLKQFAVEINLYEDIFASCVSGSLYVGDAADLVANYKLHGNEWLILDIDKPGLKMPIQKVFRIYKISNREQKNPTTQNYTLHFVSEEMILSTQKLLSKSYKGMQISSMINDILVNQLSTRQGKIQTIQSTDGVFNIIVPRMNPLQAIEWLSTRAYSSNGSLFMFYENKNGYNFQSIETIMKQGPYAKYARRPKTDNHPETTMNSVNFLKIVQDFDIIASGRYGAYNASLMTFDLVNQKLNASVLSYGQFPLLNDIPPINGTKNRQQRSLVENPDYFLKFYPTTDSDPSTNGAHPENWLHKKAMRLAQLHTFKMVCAVPGDVNLTAGSIVEVEIPKAVPQRKTQADNELRTGLYLVSAIHHVFQNDQMATVMELLSDSMTGMLNAPNNTSQGMIEVKSG